MPTRSRSARPQRRSQPVLLSPLRPDHGGSLALLEAEVMLPEQFFSPRPSAASAHGVGALMSAVLEDALACLYKQFVINDQRTRRLARGAETWFFSDDNRWPFAFVNICAALGLDPGYLRHGLVRWRQRPPIIHQKTHRYVTRLRQQPQAVV